MAFRLLQFTHFSWCLSMLTATTLTHIPHLALYSLHFPSPNLPRDILYPHFPSPSSLYLFLHLYTFPLVDSICKTNIPVSKYVYNLKSCLRNGFRKFTNTIDKSNMHSSFPVREYEYYIVTLP